MRNYISTFPNRTLCEVLKELRKCHETRNFSYMIGLIEEAQSMGNRMEAKLQDMSDLEDARRVLKNIKKEVQELEDKKEELKDV